MSKKDLLKKSILFVLLCMLAAACAKKAPVPEVKTETGDYKLIPVDSYDTKEKFEYTNEGIKSEKKDSFSSSDELCRIDVYEEYFDVTLDYEKGEQKEVGAAYAECINKVFPLYGEVMEPYIYENIKVAFSGRDVNYEALTERMNSLYQSLLPEYQEEIKGFAETISSGEHGFQEDEKISYEEAILIQIIPDALRGTACSALSLWGVKTETGKGITLRSLEWVLGSENQMGKVQTVLHMKNGSKSFTSISMLGLFDIISGVNDNGVFAAILDVESNAREPFVFKGKTCYTYAVRHALEEFTTAREVAGYMVENSGSFTFCHNVVVTDETSSYCAEDCVKEVSDKKLGFSALRDADTPLMAGLSWSNPCSLCVVNSFSTEGNQDSYTRSMSNLVRFQKYNRYVAEQNKFSVADVKKLITKEQVNQSKVMTIHRSSAVQLILIDYATKEIQVAFTGEEGTTDKPLFLHVGTY